MFKRKHGFKLDSQADLKYKKKREYLKEEPYLCPRCNKVWQPLSYYDNIAEYLRDFPKIGCAMHECSNCQ